MKLQHSGPFVAHPRPSGNCGINLEKSIPRGQTGNKRFYDQYTKRKACNESTW